MASTLCFSVEESDRDNGNGIDGIDNKDNDSHGGDGGDNDDDIECMDNIDRNEDIIDDVECIDNDSDGDEVDNDNDIECIDNIEENENLDINISSPVVPQSNASGDDIEIIANSRSRGGSPLSLYLREN